MLNHIVSFFTYFPYAVFVLAMAVFVLRLNLGVRGKAIWAMVLLVCCSKFLCFRELGGHAFTPELPAAVIWTWNWAYSGAMILAAPFLDLLRRLPLLAHERVEQGRLADARRADEGDGTSGGEIGRELIKPIAGERRDDEWRTCDGRRKTQEDARHET